MNTTNNASLAAMLGGIQPKAAESNSTEDNDLNQASETETIDPSVGAGNVSSQPWLEQKEAVPVFVYRRDDIREFMMGEFHFRNHVLTVNGDDKNEDFLRLLSDMPEIDQNHIYVFHPEALASVRSAVDFSSVQRGVATTKNIPDAKAQSVGGIDRRPLV